MKHKKASSLIALVAGVGLLLTSCASDGGDNGSSDDASVSEDTVEIAHLVGHISDFTQAQHAGIQRAAEENGANVTIFDAEDSSAETQDRLCQDIISANRFDSIVLDAADGQALQVCVEEAIAAGIEVVTIWTPVGPDPRTSDIQVEGQAGAVVVNPEEFYGLVFDVLVEACADLDPCNVVSVIGFKGYTPENIRVESWEAWAEDHPNINFLAWGEDSYDAAQAVVTAQDLLRANPDVDVYTTSGDTTAVAVIPVLEELGMDGQVKLVGDGASERGLAAISSGEQFGSVPLFPQEMGYQAALRAIAAAKGEEIPQPAALNAVADLFPDLPRFVNQSNADQFTPEW